MMKERRVVNLMTGEEHIVTSKSPRHALRQILPDDDELYRFDENEMLLYAVNTYDDRYTYGVIKDAPLD